MAETTALEAERTPAALEALIRKGRDPDRFIAFFAGMAEKDRRALAPVAIKAVRDLTEDGDLWRMNPALLDEDWGWPRAVPALLATATLSELKRLGNRGIPSAWRPGADACITILLDRRPDWLDRWCEWLIHRSALHWPIVRRLVREGPCAAPESPNYVLGMIAGLLVWTPPEHTILDALLADRELLDDMVWRLFETEGTAEMRLSQFMGPFDDKRGWAHALRQLSALGELDRARLLDASLEALARDLDPEQTGWFAHFHNYMEPTPDERAARIDSYLARVASPVSTAAGMAIRSLKALHKAGKLDTGLFLEQIEPALYTTTKGNAKPILQMLADIAKRDEDACRQAVLLAASLLEHPDTEIQETVLKFLERSGDPGDGALREAVEQRLSIMAPSMRNRAAAWIGAEDLSESLRPATDDGEIDDLLAQAEELPADLATWFGVDAALEELRSPRGTVPAIDRYPPKGRRKLAALVRKQVMDEIKWFILGMLLFLVFSPLLVFGYSVYYTVIFIAWIVGRIRGTSGRKPARKPYEAPYRAIMAETLFGEASAWNKFRLFLRPRPAYAREVTWSSKYIERSGSGGTHIRPACGLAMEPGIPLTQVGALLIGLDLQMSDPGDRQLAADLLIDTIEAGKLDGAMISAAIVTLFDHGALRPRRMTPCLTQAAQSSPLHAQTIRQALERSLHRLAAMPRDMHLLLELYYELSVEAKEAVTDPDYRSFLASIDGTGRAAKAAKKLSALEEGDPLPHRRAAAALALAGRVERAERWAGATG
jgi:hypothetical protein